jgi:preprotein translocase subunit SecD
MFDTNGVPTLVPNNALPSLAVYLHAEDAKRFAGLTGRAFNKRLLIMLDKQALTAPTVVAPIETGSFTIGFRGEAELKKTQDDLKKLIHEAASSER